VFGRSPVGVGRCLCGAAPSVPHGSVTG
jgi:hypothetical protein